MLNRKGAFTLIELLVVIAIIAILAAILFPVFAQAKVAAKKITSISNMKQLGTAVYLYADASDDLLPLSGYQAGIDPQGRLSCYSWRYAILPYVRATGAYSSPQNAYADTPYWDGICSWAGIDTSAPAIDSQVGIKISYAGANSWANPGTVEWWKGSWGTVSMGDVPRASSLIMILESKYWYEDMGTWTITWQDPAGTPGSGPYTSYTGKSNYVFFDTHAKTINPCASLGALTWKYGTTPPDDYLWEWWGQTPAGDYINPDELRSWRDYCVANTTEYH